MDWVGSHSVTVTLGTPLLGPRQPATPTFPEHMGGASQPRVSARWLFRGRSPRSRPPWCVIPRGRGCGCFLGGRRFCFPVFPMARSFPTLFVYEPPTCTSAFSAPSSAGTETRGPLPVPRTLPVRKKGLRAELRPLDPGDRGREACPQRQHLPSLPPSFKCELLRASLLLS